MFITDSFFPIILDLAEFKQGLRFDHAYLVGVSDPTGQIPTGQVFITGMGDKAPAEVFLTRVRLNAIVSLCELLQN